MVHRSEFDQFSELSNLYRTAPIGLCLVDTDLRFVRINERMAAINGRSVAEHIGKTIRDVIPEIADQVEAAYRMVLETGEPLVDIEVHGETPAHPGEVRSWIVSHHPVRSLDGTILGVSNVVHDVTEQVRVERELERHRGHLEELVRKRSIELEETHARVQKAERLASIGTFAAGIAHQINNPLGGILLAAQSAQASHGDTEVVAIALEDIVSDVKRCGRVVRNLLLFARTGTVDKAPTDLDEIVRAALLRARDAIVKAGIATDLHLSGSMPSAALNSTALEEVVVILVGNSIEAGASRLSLRTLCVGEVVRLQVEDDGSGISRENQPRVFDPFFTTRQSQGGSGLGLSIAHGVVAQHRGRIEIESEPGRGTTVMIELPLRSDDSRDDAPR